MMSKAIVIEFKGGAFSVIEDASRILIYVDRNNQVSHLTIDGRIISGESIVDIKGEAAKTRIRYGQEEDRIY